MSKGLLHPASAVVALLTSAFLVVGGLSGVAWAEDEQQPAPSELAETDSGDSDGDGDLDSPDSVSASVNARLRDEKVEDLSQRTETNQTFANPDGTWTSTDFLAPVRLLRDEEWVDVDYTLVEGVDGSWAPKASPVELVIGGGANEATRITYGDGDSVAVTWPEALPEPTIEGTVATFAVSASTDLVVEVTGGGVNAHLRLNEPPADSDPVFTFGLVADGVDVSKSGGGLKIVDEGDVISRTTPLVAWDARTDDAGSPLETVPLESTLTEVPASDDRSEHELELTTPEGFLTDPSTQYPVIIDPSFDVSMGGIQDTWVRNGDATNHSGESQLVVGKINGASNVNPAQSFLKFDTSQLAGTTVNSASLSLWQSYAFSCENRNMNVYPVTSAWSNSMTWANRGAATSAYGSSISQNLGYGTICASGRVTANVTGMAQAWAAAQLNNHGIRLAVSAADEGQSSFERRFCSMNCSNPDIQPSLTVTYSKRANQPQPPYADGMQRGSTFWANSITPTVWAASEDPDDDPDQLSYYVGARYVNGAAPVGIGDTGCYTPWAPSGHWMSCVIPNKITDAHTYALQTLAHDNPFGTVTPSAWSAETRVTIDAFVPSKPTISCTGPGGSVPYNNNSWTVTRTATSITCTASSPGAYDIVFERDKNKVTTPEYSLGASVTKTVSVPLNGVVALDFTARSKSGNATPASYTFGVGASSILPVEEERTTTTVPMLATSEAGALSAKVQWRPAGSADTAWVDAKKTGNTFDNVRVASTNAPWTGTVQNSSTTSTVDLVWSPNNEPNINAPSHVESRVVFTYVNNLLMETPARSVQVVPHAFGGSFPSQDFGPGQVALFTGEFKLSETDVDVPAYSGSLTLGRSHLSLGGATTGPAGVFGPGWTADFAGPDYGVASYSIDDRRAADGSIYVTAPSGESYGYGKDDGSVGAAITGRFNGLGEYAVDEDYLSINAAGTELSMTEADGTVTKFTKPDTVWLAQEVVSAEANSTVTYAYTGTNVSWIFAPKPGGITSCSTTAQTAGCRALEIVYITVDGKTRVSEVKLHIWDPKPTTGGTPDPTAAAMVTVTVAKYSYTTDAKLSAAWDPRLGDDGTPKPPLKTEYTYDTAGAKTVIKTVTPPGLKPWTINYDTNAKVKTLTRPQDADAGTGNATWTVKYDLGLSASGDGLPDLSAAATATWGQPELDAPYGAAAVFGPDQVPDATPTAAQYEYADLSYWTTSGRKSNTAIYGAGAWQIESTRYDDKGNPVWELTSAGKADVLAERAANPGAGQAEATRVAASKYATLTTYTPGDERRVTATYGPMSIVSPQDSGAPTNMLGRKLTRTVYDDSASTDLKPGYPSTGVPVGGFGLPVEETKRISTSFFPYDPDAAGAPTEYDIDTTRYTYDPVVAGDGDGWQLGEPTRVKVKTGPNEWAITMTRYDTEGKVIETRTPEGTESSNGTGADTRSTKTTYYTVGANSADSLCGNKPEWAGSVCKTGPGGGAIPTTRIHGYSMFLTPTRIVEAQGSTARTDVTTYDVAGRTVKSATTTSGISPADRAVPAVTTTYDGVTGLPTKISNGTATQDQVTTYDSWGRIRTFSDGAGATATTGYDAAGRVRTKNDGKATYTFTFNGTDSRGNAERRGVVTSVDVGKPTGIGTLVPSTFTAAYDSFGALAEQNYPGGVKATYVRDLNGVETGLSYATSDGTSLLTYATTVDVNGRVVNQTGAGSTQKFTYDKRDRLTQVEDIRAGECTTRRYAFSGDSNRQMLTTFAPGTGGGCQTESGTSTGTIGYNDSDQLSGDTFDGLGRTTTMASGAGGDATIGYHANDMVATVTQGTAKQDYSLDRTGRVSKVKNLASSVSLKEATNHYDGASDSPAWTQTQTRPDASTAWTQTWERNVTDLTGSLGVIQTSSGKTKLQLPNLHGDVAATYVLGESSPFTAAPAVDEYGKPIENGEVARYGWVGAKQRDSSVLGGLTLMGARLYNGRTGRFLSRDPLPGGNDNSYVYPTDPVNNFDLDGLKQDPGSGSGLSCTCTKANEKWKTVRTYKTGTKWARDRSLGMIGDVFHWLTAEAGKKLNYSYQAQKRSDTTVTTQQRCRGGRWRFRETTTTWTHYRGLLRVQVPLISDRQLTFGAPSSKTTTTREY